jgi:hypothetical protein
MNGGPKMIKKLFKKWTRLQALEDATNKANQAAEAAMEAQLVAEENAKAAEEAEAQAKMTPKERATLKGEAWVDVLDMHVNKENIRNGFFELDWNDEFVLQLKQAGYGFDGDPEEEIVDRWFRDLAGNMLAEAGEAEPSKTIGGYININRLDNGRAEVQ